MHSLLKLLDLTQFKGVELLEEELPEDRLQVGIYQVDTREALLEQLNPEVDRVLFLPLQAHRLVVIETLEIVQEGAAHN